MGAHTAVRQVTFASPTSSRPAKDDERYVMKRFADHASHCPDCANPLEVTLRGGTLCDKGQGYARDVGQYIYTKGGKAYSVVARQYKQDKVQIEIPSNYSVIRDLCKAIDRGLSVKREKPIVSQDSTYQLPERPRTERRDAYEVVTIKPSSSREEKRRHDGKGKGEKRKTVYVQGRGSLYEKDEAERRYRERYEGAPIIINAAPRRTHAR